MTMPGGTGVWVAFAISLSRQDTQRLKHVTKQMDGKWHWFMQRVSIMWAQWMENCEVWHLFEWCKCWEIFQIIYLVGKKQIYLFIYLLIHLRAIDYTLSVPPIFFCLSFCYNGIGVLLLIKVNLQLVSYSLNPLAFCIDFTPVIPTPPFQFQSQSPYSISVLMCFSVFLC